MSENTERTAGVADTIHDGTRVVVESVKGGVNAAIAGHRGIVAEAKAANREGIDHLKRRFSGGSDSTE